MKIEISEQLDLIRRRIETNERLPGIVTVGSYWLLAAQVKVLLDALGEPAPAPTFKIGDRVQHGPTGKTGAIASLRWDHSHPPHGWESVHWDGHAPDYRELVPPGHLTKLTGGA